MKADPPQALFLHCALAHSGVWAPIREQLRGVNSVAIDLPGHGAAPDWKGLDYQMQARDLAVDALTGPAHLVGHSFGATVALRLAMDFPDLVKSLVLIEPVFFAAAREDDPDSFGFWHADFSSFETAMESGDNERGAELFNDIWGAVRWSSVPVAQKKYVIDRIHLIPASAPSIMDDNAGLWDALPSINVPCLLIEGTKSPPVIAAIQTALEKRLPHTERVVIEGAGHMVPISHPSDIAEHIRAFINL